jgi:hypothetical protein
MKKQIIRISFGILFTGFVLLIIYLFNAEKFYSEYWLQKRIDTFSCIEPLENIDNVERTLLYKFYDDSGIDIEVLLNNNGYVSIGRYKWFKDNQNSKTHIFSIDKNTIESLITDFRKVYSKSEFTDTDNHLGGHYATLTFKENNSGEVIEIGFYNVTPDNKFKEITSKIIDIGNKVITDLEK